MTEEADSVQGSKRRRTEADAAPSEPAGPLWAMSPAEWRLLAITFVGGVGSIVVAAGIVGAAIALARRATGSPQFWLFIAGAMVVLAAVVLMSRFWIPAYGPRYVRLVLSVLEVIIVAACVVLFAVAMLVLIGRAAGIK